MKKQLLARIQELSGQPLNELFVDTDGAETDEDILRSSIIAETDAVSLYKKFAKRAKSKKIKKIMLDVAEEEEVHKGEFEGLLKSISTDYDKNLKKGEKESNKKSK